MAQKDKERFQTESAAYRSSHPAVHSQPSRARAHTHTHTGNGEYAGTDPKQALPPVSLSRNIRIPRTFTAREHCTTQHKHCLALQRQTRATQVTSRSVRAALCLASDSDALPSSLSQPPPLPALENGSLLLVS
jgi:hypothetical protein